MNSDPLDFLIFISTISQFDEIVQKGHRFHPNNVSYRHLKFNKSRVSVGITLSTGNFTRSGVIHPR